MTATTRSATSTPAHALAPTPHEGRAGHYRFRDAAAAEWTKLTSVRSARWTLVAFAVVTIGLGMLVSLMTGRHYPQLSASDRALFDPTNRSLLGLVFGELALGVLGALVMTGEYGTGAIRSTLAAVPRRRTVLLAKAAVFGAVALVVGEVVTFAAFLAGQAVMGEPHTTLGAPHVVRALVLSGLFLALLGLFALALATIFRHSAGAIGAFVGVVLVLPFVLAPLPGNAVRFAPEAILGSSVAVTIPEAGFLGPWTGLGVMAVYTATALGFALWRFERRDA